MIIWFSLNVGFDVANVSQIRGIDNITCAKVDYLATCTDLPNICTSALFVVVYCAVLAVSLDSHTIY